MNRLPDFLIIGSYKCGTTSLVDYLGQHPRVYLPWLQEPNYFAYEHDLESTGTRPDVDGASIYRRQRARTGKQYASLFEAAPSHCLVGECSPEYMHSPYASQRILEAIPAVRLLALLRNPVDRAFSDYQAFVRDGIEDETFDQAIKRPFGRDSGQQYVVNGFYGRQLKTYFGLFPREHIKVMLSADLRTGPRELLADVCDWLGVGNEGYVPDISQTRNVSGRPRNLAVSSAYRLRRRLRPWVKPLVSTRVQRRADAVLASGLKREDMSAEARSTLVKTYRKDIELLEELIDRDLAGWKQ